MIESIILTLVWYLTAAIVGVGFIAFFFVVLGAMFYGPGILVSMFAGN